MSDTGKLIYQLTSADALKDAANNPNGAMNGFVGVGMMNMASGGVFGGAVQNAQAPQGAAASQAYNPYQGQNSQGQPLHPGVVAHGENAEELDDKEFKRFYTKLW